MSNTKIVNIDFTAPESGTNYKGQFIIKRFTVRDHGKIAVTKTRLNGGLHYNPNGSGVDEDVDNYHYYLATVEVGIVNAPSWWSLEEIYDFSLVKEIFQEVITFQNSFRPNRGTDIQPSGSNAGVQSGSNSKAQEANGPRSAPKMVEHEVQYTLDP